MSEALEIGKHPARAVGGLLGKAETGTEQIAVECVFVDGPNKDRTITWYGYFTERAEAKTLESLRNLGFKGDQLDDLSSLSGPDTPVVTLVLEEEEYNGEYRVKVAWVNKLGGAAMKNPMDGEQAKSFAERMKSRIAAIEGGPKPTRRAAAPRPQDPRVSTRPDDDIPF